LSWIKAPFWYVQGRFAPHSKTQASFRKNREVALSLAKPTKLTVRAVAVFCKAGLHQAGCVGLSPARQKLPAKTAA
jgi:hypothetical protein